jgi:hypothetical protein
MEEFLDNVVTLKLMSGCTREASLLMQAVSLQIRELFLNSAILKAHPVEIVRRLLNLLLEVGCL